MYVPTFPRWWQCLAVLTLCSMAVGQEPDEPLPKLNLLDQLKVPGLSGGAVGGEVTFTGKFEIFEGGRDGRVAVTAEMLPTWHIYSVTQPQPGGTQRSVIKAANPEQVQITGDFQPDKPPEVKHYDFFEVPIEEHAGTVIWTAPIRLAEGVDPQGLTLELKFNGQVCEDKGSCIPINNRSIPAEFAGFVPPAETAAPQPATAAAEPPRAELAPTPLPGASEHVTIRGQIEPTDQSGATFRLSITADLAPTWHIYALEDADPQLVAKPALIVLDEVAGMTHSAPRASSEPIVSHEGTSQQPVLRYHETQVTWTVDLSVADASQPRRVPLSGLFGYQVCSTSCDRPQGLRFTGEIAVGDPTAMAAPVPLTFTAVPYSAVAQAAAARGPQLSSGPTSGAAAAGFDPSRLVVADETKDQPWWYAVGIALAGGFILNFMPCVLPVIGLKIMSFVQQAGESRWRAFALNLWYSAGLLSVFAVLATLAAVWNLGWGQQNQSEVFNIVMAAIVFTMGLSFLGVWEIPIPGFVGGDQASELAAREGIAGAFAKGIITTILAVPCSGPLVASALAWSTGKPPAMVYLTFGCMGLGMASPYLVIGAFPQLARLLPKPGAWMDTFKQTMGFVLLGTVIWILSYLDAAQVLPTLALLFGLWAACWAVGRIKITAAPQTKLRTWALAAAFAIGIGMFAFLWFDDVMAQRFTITVEREIARLQERTPGVPIAAGPRNGDDAHLPWQPFTTQRLEELTAAGQTVMVDFTADWCPTCKVLESTVLNTPAVQGVVTQQRIVPLVADWTDGSAEISAMLELLGSKQIPVLAIFPADRPNNPIVLRGWYTKAQLVEQLREAGPSAATSGNVALRANERSNGR